MISAAYAIRDFLTQKGYQAEIDYAVAIHSRVEITKQPVLKVTPISEVDQLGDRNELLVTTEVGVLLLQKIDLESLEEQTSEALRMLETIRDQLLNEPVPNGWVCTGNFEFGYDAQLLESRSLFVGGFSVELVRCK